MRRRTYVLLHFVHSISEILRSVLVVGNRIGQAVLDDIAELQNAGGQTLTSHRLRCPAALERGSHLVPEDVASDGRSDLDDDHQREQDGKLWGRAAQKGPRYSCGFLSFLLLDVCGQSLKHRGDHAVVLLPGAAATKEGDEEDHHADADDDDGDARGRGVVDPVGVVQSKLSQDADDNQRHAA